MNPYYLVIIVSLGVFFAAVVVVENTAQMTFRKISVTIIASIIGLIISSLLAFPISKLPGIWGEAMPLSVSIISVLAMIILLNRNEKEIEETIDTFYKFFIGIVTDNQKQQSKKSSGEAYIDSSALIDGRLVEIIKNGFLNQEIIIPKFILNELQQIADSKDSSRRALGRRGLESVATIRKNKEIGVVVSDTILEKSEAADHKLLDLAKQSGGSLITTDYNLNKLAEAQGVRVLNINDLAKGLRINLLPGDEFMVKIVHLGKDNNQGVGYFDDGTMIVVENAKKYLEKQIKVKISRSLQTTAGKMYFAKIVDTNGN